MRGADPRPAAATSVALALILLGFAVGHPAQAQTSDEPLGPPTAATDLDRSLTPDEPVADAREDARHAAMSASGFVRIREDDAGQMRALETSITRYTTPAGAGVPFEVTLVSVIHLGERGYYADLDRELATYETVLYELIAPEGTRVPRGGLPEEERTGLSGLQSFLAEQLDLEFQLDHIDYTRANMVHADMSLGEMGASMIEHAENPAQTLARLLAYSMSSPGPSELSILLAFLSDDPAMALRRLFARQLLHLDFALALLEGPNGSTLVARRNRRALAVLATQIDAGARNLAILYGSAHCPDFAARLESELGLVQQDRRWLTAWRLTSDPLPSGSPAVSPCANCPGDPRAATP